VSSELALTTAANKTLESGIWTQSIIWEPRAPFRDFTQIEFNHEDDVVPEERTSMSPVVLCQVTNALAAETVRPRKRMRFDATQVRDKFNMSNDHLYEVSKDGGRHRVRQTFGQIAVEHAYPAQKLQLPFVSGLLLLLVSPLLLFAVQNAPIQARSTLLPQACFAVSCQY
jgi:transcription initiation factor TFIID subunit 1